MCISHMISVWTPVASGRKKWRNIGALRLHDLYFKTMWLYDVWQFG